MVARDDGRQTLDAGKDMSAPASSASSLPKTGAPNPFGQRRTTQVTSPPHESPFLRMSSMTAFATCGLCKQAYDKHHACSSCKLYTLIHLLSCICIWTSDCIAFYLLRGDCIVVYTGLNIFHSTDITEDLQDTPSVCWSQTQRRCVLQCVMQTLHVWTLPQFHKLVSTAFWQLLQLPRGQWFLWQKLCHHQQPLVCHTSCRT